MSGLIDPEKYGFTWHDISYRAKSAFAVLLSLAVLIGGGVYAYTKVHNAWTEFRTAEDYPGPGTEEVVVAIPRGATTYQISDILVANDVIKAAKTFDVAAANEPKSSTIQAGRYRLRKQIPAQTALAMLIDPNNIIRTKVTIPEGLRISQTLDRLAKPLSDGGTGIAREEFQAVIDSQLGDLGLPDYAAGNPEGFLFPETYNFAMDGSAVSVLQQMVAQFQAVSSDIGLVPNASAAGRTPQEIVIVASLVEAEARRDEDRGKVARVIYNRLESGMNLGLDSTVHYAVGKDGSVFTTDEDRANPSPYNTYRHQGLPPGPIGAPGKASLQAALAPTPGKWEWFVAVNLETGETLFSETEEEHIANTNKLREWCAANAGRC